MASTGPEIWTFPSRLLSAGEGGRQTRNPRLTNFHRPMERVSFYHRAAPRDTPLDSAPPLTLYAAWYAEGPSLLEQLRESLQTAFASASWLLPWILTPAKATFPAHTMSFTAPLYPRGDKSIELKMCVNMLFKTAVYQWICSPSMRGYLFNSVLLR
jgi:hypothetical protein